MIATKLIAPLSRACAALFATAATASIAYSQDSEIDEDNVYIPSPFVVSDSDNAGYKATSTLAGTRIKTNLSDIGAAISVITPEILADLTHQKSCRPPTASPTG